MLPWPVSRAVLPAILAAGAAVACAQPTGLVLHLDVPDDSTLAPDSAATVTIEARRAGAAPITITAPLDGASFDLGDLPVGEVTSLRAPCAATTTGWSGTAWRRPRSSSARWPT